MASSEMVGKWQVEHDFSAAIVRPGDALVIAVRSSITAEGAARIKQDVAEKLPGVRTVVMAGVSQVLVYQPDDVKAVEAEG